VAAVSDGYQPSTVTFVPSRRSRLLQSGGDLMAAAMLVFGAADSLKGAATVPRPLAWLDIVVGGAVITWIVASIRHDRERPRWATVAGDLLLGLLLFVQGLNLLHPGSRFQPAHAYFLSAVLFVATAPLRRRSADRNNLRLSPAGLQWRQWPRRAITVATGEAVGLQLSPRAIEIRLRDGRHRRLGLSRWANGHAIVAAVTSWAQEQGVPVEPGGRPGG
jgi:hypothetical protein